MYVVGGTRLGWLPSSPCPLRMWVEWLECLGVARTLLSRDTGLIECAKGHAGGQGDGVRLKQCPYDSSIPLFTMVCLHTCV